MKKTNKGFSMVELIIVIAIMAILAGALAPALIKYINKSRLSTDIQTGQAVASAIQTALGTESGYDAAEANYTAANWYSLTQLYTNTDDMAKEVQSTVGKAGAKVKSKKCMNGTALGTGTIDFWVNIDAVNNAVTVVLGTGAPTATNNVYDHQVYPSPTTCLSDSKAADCHTVK